jgi:hypothetical protein
MRMTLMHAYAIATGTQAPLSVDQAAQAIAVLEENPEVMTNGEVCRGYERLKYLVDFHADMDE